MVPDLNHLAVPKSEDVDAENLAHFPVSFAVPHEPVLRGLGRPAGSYQVVFGQNQVFSEAEGGDATLKSAPIFAIPATPGSAWLGRRSWRTESSEKISAVTSTLPWFHTSSYKRRTSALFSALTFRTS